MPDNSKLPPPPPQGEPERACPPPDDPLRRGGWERAGIQGADMDEAEMARRRAAALEQMKRMPRA